MTDQDVRDFLKRMAAEEPVQFLDAEPLASRARRRAARTVVVSAVGLAAAIAVLFAVVPQLREEPRVPVDPPEKSSVDLGIFEPVAGRIVHDARDRSLWAVDPDAPSPVSTRVRLDLGGAADAAPFAPWTLPLGWSSDGTKLLHQRPEISDGQQPPFDYYLYILHADGTQTQVTPEPVVAAADAAISPDGTRIAFSPSDGALSDGKGVYVVDAEGGEPVLIAQMGASPTFSPDGTQIAYLSLPWSGCCDGTGRQQVWVVNTDGTGAHEILAEELALAEGVLDLTWSPADDRIAMEISLEGRVAIYTFAPDGSDFTEVIPDGTRPHWSPDGSQIAYSAPGRDGLSIADADGSNVRALGVGESGPWHPGATAAPEGEDVPAIDPTPTPPGPILRTAGEVLWYPFNGGDLLTVNPSTGEERVIAEGLPYLNEAMWSADGRWVAYERSSRTRSSLWVVGEDLEPRKVMDLPDESQLARSWAWSSTGAQLAVDRNSMLHVIDPATGLVTEFASTAKVDSPPAWSPDGTRIVLGATGGTIYSVDVRTGERSLLAQLPVEDPASVHGIAWSPDGSRLAVLTDLALGSARLFVLNADGSDTRVLAEYEEGLDPRVLGIDWSPDGSRIVVAENDGTEYRIWVVPADGSMPSLVASAHELWGTNPVWSPDGSRIAFSEEPNRAFVIDADGSGDAEPIDDLTYASWSGGSFCWDCLWWVNHPVSYTEPSDT